MVKLSDKEVQDILKKKYNKGYTVKIKADILRADIKNMKRVNNSDAYIKELKIELYNLEKKYAEYFI